MLMRDGLASDTLIVFNWVWSVILSVTTVDTVDCLEADVTFVLVARLVAELLVVMQPIPPLPFGESVADQEVPFSGILPLILILIVSVVFCGNSILVTFCCEYSDTFLFTVAFEFSSFCVELIVVPFEVDTTDRFGDLEHDLEADVIVARRIPLGLRSVELPAHESAEWFLSVIPIELIPFLVFFFFFFFLSQKLNK